VQYGLYELRLEGSKNQLKSKNKVSLSNVVNWKL